MERIQQHLMSAPTRIQSAPVGLDKLDQCTRERLMDFLQSKVENWHNVPQLVIPDDWRTIDLQSILTAKGFYPLATAEFLAGEADKHYADLDFSKPAHFHRPPEKQRGYFRNPAINIDRVGENLKLTFGHVFNTASGWRITNSTASHLDPEKLIVPSPVSYFKQR